MFLQDISGKGFLNSWCQIQVHKQHPAISKAPEMSLGGNSRSLSDFLCHILTALITLFFKNTKSRYVIPHCLFCISEENRRDNSPCRCFFLRVGSFSGQPKVTMMNGSPTHCPEIWRLLQKISENWYGASCSYPHMCYTSFSLGWEELALLVLTDHGGAPC